MTDQKQAPTRVRVVGEEEVFGGPGDLIFKPRGSGTRSGTPAMSRPRFWRSSLRLASKCCSAPLKPHGGARRADPRGDRRRVQVRPGFVRAAPRPSLADQGLSRVIRDQTTRLGP